MTIRPRWSGIKHGVPNGPVAGFKFCAGDGRWRPISDFAARPDVASLDSYCHTCRARESRERTHNQTPEQRARRRETERFYRDRLRKERGTLATYQPRGPQVTDHAERVFLPLAPLLVEIDTYVAAERRNGHPDYEDGILALQAGINPRTLYRYRHESDRIRIDIADRLALAMDIPLALIYPPT